MNAVLTILIGSIFVNNFAMSRFYGICPFLGVSKKLETAFGMGMAVTFVMAVASLVAYLVNTFLLVLLGIEYLWLSPFWCRSLKWRSRRCPRVCIRRWASICR